MKLTKELSIVCCQACINSYKGTYGNVVPGLLTNVKDFSKDEVAGQVGNYGDLTLLIFNGTEGWQDIIDNIKFWKTEMPESWFGKTVNAYTGIIEQYTKARDIVYGLMQNPEKIIVTGHSLGGALATICAGDLKNNYKQSKDISCATFASPRVGGYAFAKTFNQLIPDSLRYIYNNDPVPKVPPIYIHYKHVSTKIKLGKLSKWEKILSPIWKIIGNKKDHAPAKYLEALEKLSI